LGLATLVREESLDDRSLGEDTTRAAELDEFFRNEPVEISTRCAYGRRQKLLFKFSHVGKRHHQAAATAIHLLRANKANLRYSARRATDRSSDRCCHSLMCDTVVDPIDDE
jgi:hypothetical protein